MNNPTIAIPITINNVISKIPHHGNDFFSSFEHFDSTEKIIPREVSFSLIFGIIDSHSSASDGTLTSALSNLPLYLPDIIRYSNVVFSFISLTKLLYLSVLFTSIIIDPPSISIGVS